MNSQSRQCTRIIFCEAVGLPGVYLIAMCFRSQQNEAALQLHLLSMNEKIIQAIHT